MRPQLDLGPIRVTPQTYVVVATQGESDEEALELALSLEASYVAFVASKTKAQKLFAGLRGGEGSAAQRLEKVRVPAGLAIGAVSPEEIAVSILAEIVQTARSKPTAAAPAPATDSCMGQEAARPEPALQEKDPVCGMVVDPATARHQSLYQGTIYYSAVRTAKKPSTRSRTGSSPRR